jgi:nicotinate phosphoribosyltransferase
MSDQFFRNAPDWFFSDWIGSRQDSGDPYKYGDEIAIPAYEQHGVDPREKIIIFSDGNTAKKMDELERHFRGRIIPRFLQGTFFTNNFAGLHPNPDALVPGLAPLTWRDVYKPFSLVCKVVEANGCPCVKLSDNPAKATGDKGAIAANLAIFGGDHRVLQEVLV